MKSGHVLFHSLIFFALILLSIAGDGANRAGANDIPDTQADRFPASWVLLDDRPALWSRPGSEPTETRLDVAALERVQVTAAADGDEKAKRWLRVSTPGQSGWLPEALLAPPPTTIEPDELGRIGQEPVDRYRGIAPEYVPTDLEEVAFGYEADRTYLLRRRAARALENMIGAARREGLELQVVSAYRSYTTQRRIYLGKLKRSGWLQDTVAKPGHSEHQLGTTVDLNGPDESTLLRRSFGETAEGQWLRRHAPNFGFALSYTEANREVTGYAPEPWHYRYYGTKKAAQRHAAALGLRGS